MFLEHLGGVLSLRTHFWLHFKSLGDKDFFHPNSVIRQNSQKKWILVEYSGGVEYSTGPKNFGIGKYTIRPFQNRFDHLSTTILRWDTDTSWGGRKNRYYPAGLYHVRMVADMVYGSKCAHEHHGKRGSASIIVLMVVRQYKSFWEDFQKVEIVCGYGQISTRIRKLKGVHPKHSAECCKPWTKSSCY